MNLEEQINADDVLELKRSFNQLRNELEAVKQCITELKHERDEVRADKKEVYYQRFLEKHLGATHKVVKHGITDITTAQYHIEIKRWNNYKHSIGQLLAYNLGDNKHLIAAFFGVNKGGEKEKALEYAHSRGIEVWELLDTPYGVEIIKHGMRKTNGMLIEWLEENIVYEPNSVLHSKQIYEVFYNVTKIRLSNKQKAELKEDIQRWINVKFPSIDHTFQDSTFMSIKFKGWIHLAIK